MLFGAVLPVNVIGQCKLGTAGCVCGHVVEDDVSAKMQVFDETPVHRTSQ